MSSDGKEPLSIISASGDKKLSDTKLTTIDLKAKEAEANGDVLYVNWRNEFPIKVKKILFTMKENSAKVYESTTPRTMKLLALISSLILFFGILSLVLAQRDEAAQSKYGMAFPIEEASNKAEKRVSASLSVSAPLLSSSSSSSSSGSASPPAGVPGEAISVVNSDAGKDATTTPISSLDDAANDEDKNETDKKPRIVFIERLMGLHVSAPLRQNEAQSGNDEKETESEALGPKNPLDKLNAKWASRMRKFSIPLPPTSVGDNQPPQGPLGEQPNPMLRYAAAAMMSRLVAAAARAQMEAQAQDAINHHQINSREGKDKDEESEDETVPVIVASIQDDRAGGNGGNGMPLGQHGMAPMYGRPMTPRGGPMMRGMGNIMPFHEHQGMSNVARHAMPSMPQRAYVAPPPPPPPPAALQGSPVQARSSIMAQRRSSQPVLVMLALPVGPGSTSESRQSTVSQMQFAPIMSQRSAASHGPFYPSVPYTYPVPGASYAVPIQMPVPMPTYQRQVLYHYPVQADMQRNGPVMGHSYPIVQASHSRRPVVEVPVEVPVPYHIPITVPVAMRPSGNQVVYGHHHGDNDASSSDHDQIVLLYDAELHHTNDDLESSSSDVAGYQHRSNPFTTVTRPLPSLISANKMKFWREFAASKHVQPAEQRFIPVAISAPNDADNEQSSVHFPSGPSPIVEKRAEQLSAESGHQPAFIVLAEQDEH